MTYTFTDLLNLLDLIFTIKITEGTALREKQKQNLEARVKMQYFFLLSIY